MDWVAAEKGGLILYDEGIHEQPKAMRYFNW
jgi:hypothetical protein